MSTVIPITAVLEMVDGLCPECMAKIRCKMAQAASLKAEGLKGILEETCARMGYESCLVQARNNSAELVKVRRAVAFAARKAGYSLPAIGRILHRHHTSVLHLLK